MQDMVVGRGISGTALPWAPRISHPQPACLVECMHVTPAQPRQEEAGTRISLKAHTSAALLLLMILASMAGSAQEFNPPREIQASEVLEKISQGEDVEYDEVIIVGNLDLGNLNLPKDDFGRGIIADKICICGSQIDGDVNFNNSKFMSKVDLLGTTFLGNATFNYSHFDSIVSLKNASFLKEADFIWAEFRGRLDISNASFSEGACFDHAEIYDYCDLRYGIFKGDASFKDTVFSSYAFFNGAQFDDGASFYRAEFHRETRFGGARFLGYANFNDSRFGDYAYFLGSEFQGLISLNNTRITDLMIDWGSIRGHLVYNEAAYQALIQRFWASGNFDDYYNSYYQFRRLKQSYEPMGITKAIDILAWIICGYGVRPLRALGSGLMIIILFGIIYWKIKLVPRFNGTILAESRTRGESTISALEEAIYFSTMMFVTRPPYGLHPAGRWRYLIILEYVSGWLTMALFLVIMARLMIR
jgi:hypothetical protein